MIGEILAFVLGILNPQANAATATANLAIQVTQSGGGGGGLACARGPNFMGTVPAGAAATGMTACAYNYDFRDSLYANMSTWLDCAGAGSPQFWVEGYLTAAKAPCSAFSIVNDGASNALKLHWDLSYWTDNNTGIHAAELESAPNDGYSYPSVGDFFPAASYVEVVERVSTITVTTGGRFTSLGDIFSWTAPPIAPNALEWDWLEQGTDGGWNGGGGPNYSYPGFPPSATWYTGTNSNANHYPGITNYHNYASLQNIESNGTTYRCNYLDDVKMSCSGPGQDVNPPNPTQDLRQARQWVKMGMGPTNDNQNYDFPADMFVQRITIFSCPNWRTTQCFGPGLPGF